ncbi:MAG: DUF1549 and DUF1553 domain-containing protein, partial [Pirellulaceae bacterium]
GVVMSTSGGLSSDWNDRRYEPDAVWAYQRLKHPTPPRDGATPIDAFIDHHLQQIALQPAGTADRGTLARRIAFDLTGLPPDTVELARYLDDKRPDELATSRYVDRLLASPHYGEQWGRHWLDVARYADSSGFANDYERPNAWRYRDYVIRSFSADKPYDTFVRQQIAGDEIDPTDPENLIAVGFLRMGPWEHTGMSVAKVTRQQFLDDVTDNVGQVFLAHALQCCRCHDHKFDPIPTRDYYRIQAVFATTQFATRDAAFLQSESTEGFDEQQFLRQRLDRYQKVVDAINAKKFKLEREWYAERGLEFAPRQVKEKAGTDPSEICPKNYGLTAQDLGLERIGRKYIERHSWELDRYLPLALSVYNGKTPQVRGTYRAIKMPKNPLGDGELQQVSILSGGDVFSPTLPVQPGVLSVVRSDPSADVIPDRYDGRRTAFADWLVDPNNPLPSRVMVNRIWHYHFGKGLAGNPNNFGSTGAKPTHPELLDYLATDFIRGDWSVQRIHRRILRSEAYRRDSRHPDAEQLDDKDPLGGALAVFSPRRLSAEELRDGMLVASGSLNRQIGGISNRPDINLEAALQPRQIMGTYAPSYQPNPLPAQRNRRTIYALRLRGLRDPMMEVFNQPSPDASCEMRSTSTVTPQSLTLFNSKQSYDRALAMASNLRKTHRDESDIDEILKRAIEWSLGRLAEGDELQLLRGHYEKMLVRHHSLRFEAQPIPATVTREAIDEITGESFEFVEELERYRQYQPELRLHETDASTRALADICLVLLNSNEFIYVE